jgi:hypothetical protein
LKIGNTPVMYATGVSYGEEIEHAPVEVLDQFDVAENVPIAYRVTFSAEWVRVIKNPIKNRDGVTIMPRLEDILDAEEMTALIEDPKTDTPLASVERVKCTGYRTQVQTRGIVMQQVEFVAIRIRDESEI